MKDRFPGFKRCMAMMRKHNPQTQEDGFYFLHSRANEYIDELIIEFRDETKNFGLRWWLLELIGEARSPKAFDVLVQYLDAEDESLRFWAIRGLEKLNTKEAREILWETMKKSSP